MANSLQAGVYRVDITPPIGISMCGYFAAGWGFEPCR